MQAIIRNAFGMTILQYRGYTFHLFNVVIHGICVVEPLCKIFIYNHSKNEGKVNKYHYHCNDFLIYKHMKNSVYLIYHISYICY